MKDDLKVQSTAASSTAKITENIVSEVVPHSGSTQKVRGCGDTDCEREEIDTDACHTCFESWQDDVMEQNRYFASELHENSVEEVVEDEEGIQRFC